MLVCIIRFKPVGDMRGLHVAESAGRLRRRPRWAWRAWRPRWACCARLPSMVEALRRRDQPGLEMHGLYLPSMLGCQSSSPFM